MQYDNKVSRGRGIILVSVILMGTLFSGFTFAALYTTVSVLDLCLVVVLSTKRFRSLSNARCEVFRRWGWRILVAAALLLWLSINLYFLAVRDNVVGAFEGALHYPIGFGKVHFTLAGLFILLAGTSGLTFSVGNGTNNATMTFQGTLGHINAALDGLAFTPNAGATSASVFPGVSAGKKSGS